MKKRSVAIAAAVVGAALPLTVSVSTAQALPGNCTVTRVPGAPYPGADVFCTSGSGYYRAIVYCKSSQLGGAEREYKGNIVARGDGKHSRAFCTASYPVYNGGHLAYVFY